MKHKAIFIGSKMQKIISVMVLLSVVVSCERQSQTFQHTADITERISRVENGLLKAIIIKDQPSAMTLTERMKYFKVPGVSVAIINDGKTEWAKGYGVTEAGGISPVTTETIFQVGSISKPVATVGALVLVAKGLLSLDENVNLKLKSWKVSDNDFTKKQKVTLRRLASHSAGLTVHGFDGYAEGEAVPTTVQVLDGQKPANSAPVRVDILPGSLWRYSGGGITVMQLLMADVTGKQFPVLMRELVFDKIGMKNSTYEQQLPIGMATRAASGHHSNGETVKGKWYTYPEMAAAGLWTTPTDLAKFIVELQQTKAGKLKKVLSQEMVNQMLTRQSGNWGLGIRVDGEGGNVTFSHRGDAQGFQAMMFAYAATGQGAVVMCNSEQGFLLINEVMRSIAREYGWADFNPIERAVAKVNPEVFKSYVGEYDVEGRITVSTQDGKLYAKIEPMGGQTIELYPLSETEFFVTHADIRFVFTKDDQGIVNGMIAHLLSRSVNGKKIK